MRTSSWSLLGSLLLLVACGGSGEDAATAGGGGVSGAQGGTASGGQAGKGGTAGASAGTSGTSGQPGGGQAGQPGAGAGGTTAGGASGTGGIIGVGGVGTGGSSGSGVCQPGTTQCTDCLDNDNDGLADGFDPDCTGYLDNNEGSFATGIPGDNIDPCKQDCFFDGNSGQGDDKCEWNLACDPANPGQNVGCPYDPDQNKCPGPPSETCLKNCQKLVPNGCDCFGCCTFPSASGPKSVLLLPTCTFADIDDPVKCPVCTQNTVCNNPCDTCELCLGKNELPAECFPTGAGGSTGTGGASAGGSSTGGSSTGGTTTTGGQAGSTGTAGSPPQPVCPVGETPCTPTQPCKGGFYCLTGCCVEIIE